MGHGGAGRRPNRASPRRTSGAGSHSSQRRSSASWRLSWSLRGANGVLWIRVRFRSRSEQTLSSVWRLSSDIRQPEQYCTMAIMIPRSDVHVTCGAMCVRCFCESLRENNSDDYQGKADVLGLGRELWFFEMTSKEGDRWRTTSMPLWNRDRGRRVP